MILLPTIPESIPEKRPKTVKESKLRFFWNRNQHSPILYLETGALFPVQLLPELLVGFDVGVRDPGEVVRAEEEDEVHHLLRDLGPNSTEEKNVA